MKNIRLFRREPSVPVRILNGALLAVGLVALAGVACAYAGKFTGMQFAWVDAMNPYWMPVFGTLAHLVLTRLVVSACRIAKVRLEAFHYVVLLAAFAVCAGVYAYCVLSRDLIYFWDFAGSLVRQLELNDAFQMGIRNGLTSVLYSTWNSNYALFLNVFTAVPFYFTNQTGDAYILCALLDIVPYILVLTGALMQKLTGLLQAPNGRLRFVLGLAAAVGFPLLHAALIHGQGDMLGVVFALAAILLTVDYRFEKTELFRMALIAVFALCVLVTRRWYIMWAAPYFLCYGAYTLADAFICPDKGERWKRIRRLLLYAVACLIVLGLALLPFIRSQIGFDYATNYAYYLSGGFAGELKNQVGWIGWVGVGLMLLGVIFGCVKRQIRGIAVTAVGSWLISVFLFTRIQNMGYHQALLLTPGYLTMLLLGLSAVCALPGRTVPAAAGCAVGAALLFNLAGSGFRVGAVQRIPLFSSVTMSPDSRQDKDRILYVTNWLMERCGEGEWAYIIPHCELYNPSLFRSALLPDRRAYQVIDYGAGMLGEHAFPTALLTSKYVLVCDPMPDTGMSRKYNEAFLHGGYLKERFALEESVDMGNGYTFHIYRRTVPVDAKEALVYRDMLTEESERYPYLYKDVIDQFLAEQGLVAE